MKLKSNLIILFLFIISVALFTFPLVFKMNSHMPGFQTTDEPYAALWNFWFLKYMAQTHQVGSKCSLIIAPFGIDSIGSGYYLWDFINKSLTVATNNVFTYNFEILFSFLASAVFMYWLVLYLSGNKACSFFSTIIYAYCPYHFARAWQHLGLAQTQWMPLYVLAMLKLREKSTFRQALLAALALFLVFSFDLYYAYFMLIVSFLFVIFLLGSEWKKKIKGAEYFKNDFRFIGKLLIVFTLVFLLISPLVFKVFKDRNKYSGKESVAYNPYVRPFEDLFAQSARPLSYFLPASVHPVFGRITEGFVGSNYYGESFTEHTLYLGWVPLILAFIAFKRRKKNSSRFYINLFAFLAFCAWLFSQPPWWNLFGFKLYMPSYLMYKLLPMFRAYCRFGIVVMLAVSVLAGFGLMLVLETIKSKNKKMVVAALFFILVLFEFWNYPPFKVIDVSRAPQVYYWLAGQKEDFTIAEYPLDARSPNEMYKFYQTKHHKKIINGTIPLTTPHMIAKTMTKLSEPRTAGVLKWMGVKYVLVHKDGYLKTDLIQDREELGRIPFNKGLKPVTGFEAENCPRKDLMCVQETGPIDVYEVIAAPVKPEEER